MPTAFRSRRSAVLPTRALALRRLAVLAVLAPAFAVGTAAAQGTGTAQPIRIVAPVPPGNGSDIAMRTLAKEWTMQTGRTVLVENRPGGNNVIGAQAVIQAPADGLTLYAGSNASMAANAVSFKTLGYDPVKDLTPVAMVIRARWVMVTSSQSPYRTIDDLVAAGKADPKTLSSADGSAGFQLATALFARGAGVEINQALYKGTAPALQDLAGNQVSLAIADLSSALTLIRAGRVRPLLAITDERLPLLPDVPSMKEKGFGEMPLHSWAGLFAKAGTPAAELERLAAQIGEAMKADGFRKYVAEVNSEAPFMGPAALRDFQLKQIEAYRAAMAVAGQTPQ